MRLLPEHVLIPDPTVMMGAEVIRRVKAVLWAAPANQDVWRDERFDWPNYIYWACMEYGVNPIAILVGLQRERSLLGQKGDEHDFDFAQGVVGQHQPGSQNETWNGLPSQILLACRSLAWSAGIGSYLNFRGWRDGKGLPPWDRWRPGVGISVQLYDDVTYKPTFKRPSLDLAEHALLTFTPSHNWEKVLDNNGAILRDNVLPFWK